MSVTRAEDRPDRSHVPPTPPAKLAPADDPAWAHTLALAALAREARQAEESFIAMPIEVSRGSLDDARFALAGFLYSAQNSTTLGAPTLRGSDVEWAQQFRPDRKGQTDG